MIAPAEATRLHPREALEIITHFQTVFKLAKYYEANNSIFIEQKRPFFRSVDRAMASEGKIQITIGQNSIFVNRTRAKFDHMNYPVYKFMTGEFRQRELGTLTFRAGLTEDELGRFMVFLAHAKIPAEDKFESLLQDVAAGSFPNIVLEKILLTERPETKDRDAARMYFLGIYHLKELFEREWEVLNFNLTKRWIQSMFNHLIEDESFLYGLINIKNFDEYTFNHSVNVTILALGLGRSLGLSRHELTELGISAVLHDLGRLEIPKEILDKPAKLDPDEWALMEKHSHFGAERLVELAAARRIPARAIQVALEHHAKHDQSGYPKYVRKKSIGLFSKIVKVADYFDALTTKRVYRERVFTKDQALDLMLEKSGQEFDPVILKAFAAMIGALPIGSLVYLNTGEIGIVVETNPHASFAQRPKVKIIAGAGGEKMDGPTIDLTDADPVTRKFLRTVVKTLDPDRYGIQVSDYFLARAF